MKRKRDKEEKNRQKALQKPIGKGNIGWQMWKNMGGGGAEEKEKEEGEKEIEVEVEKREEWEEWGTEQPQPQIAKKQEKDQNRPALDTIIRNKGRKGIHDGMNETIKPTKEPSLEHINGLLPGYRNMVAQKQELGARRRDIRKIASIISNLDESNGASPYQPSWLEVSEEPDAADPYQVDDISDDLVYFVLLFYFLLLIYSFWLGCSVSC